MEFFQWKIRANSLLHRITTPGASTSARHTTFVDETVVNGTETDDVGEEIGLNEMVTGNKISCDKSVRLQLSA